MVLRLNWARARAGIRVAGGRQGRREESSSSTSCGLEPCACRGEFAQIFPCWPQAACLPSWPVHILPLSPTLCLPPGLPALGFSLSSPSPELARARAGHRGPPSHRRARLLPHFAADSSPKQNRLSPFPSFRQLSLACGCLLSLQTAPAGNRREEALGQLWTGPGGAPDSWPVFRPA